MRILAVIPARGGSKRLPGKNIRMRGDKPLIIWSIDAAKGIPEICDILVTTDSSEIAEICKECGVLVPWLRPAELATDTASSVDVAIHALDWYESEHGTVDGLLLLQPTSPFRTKETICTGIALFTKHLLRSGADKVVVNSALYENNGFVGHLASEFGQQCVVASMDIKSSPDGKYQAWSESGNNCLDGSAANWIEKVTQDHVGELYLNSMDRGGTGQGYDLGLLDLLPVNMSKPVILVGGVGNATHLAAGLADPRVDAVATAHLFNFVGDGLKQARQSLISSGVELPLWDIQLLEQHLGTEQVGKI